MITIEGLTKIYGDVTVLHGIHHHFEMGKVHGIIGANGAGKSTFFRCLTGLEKYSGQIKGLSGMHGAIGYLPTDPFVFKRITGREYLRFHCLARNIRDIDIDKHNAFDLPLDRYAAQYSTGMLKKLALTAVLLQRNEVFIFDEPFNGVDLESNMLITAIIRRLGEQKKTVFLASHIYATLSGSCDFIHRLAGGKFEQPVGTEDFQTLGLQLENEMVSTKLDMLRFG